MPDIIKNLKEFAELIVILLRSDRDVNLGVSGFTGEGKSNFLTQLFKEYGKAINKRWNFEHITWSRSELLKWIDGDKSKPSNEDGLRPGQLPLYSAILIDELFLLFYKRNWYDEGQIDGIGTLNMCRDRRLLVGGCIPNFWDLDGAYSSRMRFYVYVHSRGKAWVFQQENNPFTIDPWNKTQNRKLFRQKGTPVFCPNFVSEIQFPDWTPQEKTFYYELRNTKRVEALKKAKDEKLDKYRHIKRQRNALIQYIMLIQEQLNLKKKPAKVTLKSIADHTGLSIESVRLILQRDNLL